ncbi:hypothetical protein KGM_204837 [Danaus plexippus plexippus]|uniref:Uncharacterized protein n=1 Tax=Danaus plexippus plexippus TaxID=278856 RepID=A0A212FGU5_DANPL|nr:hypothetical protein KGM_204837 [Danaus plexippus plexippus]
MLRLNADPKQNAAEINANKQRNPLTCKCAPSPTLDTSNNLNGNLPRNIRERCVTRVTRSACCFQLSGVTNKGHRTRIFRWTLTARYLCITLHRI